jgi:cytochrome P450
MVAYEFFSAETRDNPYPLFDHLRDHNPVYETDFGYWYVSRYADVVRLLRDTRLTSGRGVPDSLGITDGPLREIMNVWMMAIDGPAHTRTRALISRAFTPRAVEAMRPTVNTIADDLVGQLVAAGGGSVIDSLAFPLPMEMTRLLFGVDPGIWDSEVVALFDPARQKAGSGYVGAMASLAAFLAVFVPQRRASPSTDLFSALMAPDEEGNRLSDLEQVANAVLLVMAGFETTMSLITNTVRTLLLHPDQLERLRGDWSLARNAVEEVLRFEPAALWTSRYATEDLAVAGGVIPAGANVLFSSVAANRDPQQFANPDHFDIGRPDIRPVTFGGGVHNCIGSALARLETEVALLTLLQRAPGLRLVEPACEEWQAENPSVRRPARLDVLV